MLLPAESMGLTRLSMGSMLLAELTILFQLQSIRIIASILVTAIIPVLALDTLQCYTYPHPVHLQAFSVTHRIYHIRYSLSISGIPAGKAQDASRQF